MFHRKYNLLFIVTFLLATLWFVLFFTKYSTYLTHYPSFLFAK